MKKISFVLIISLALVLVVFSSGMAALPGTGWWSALFIQNIGTESGTITMTAYDQDAAVPEILSDTFAFEPMKSLVYDPGKTGSNVIEFQTDLPSGFEGSVVLDASVQSASVSQVANYANGPVGGNGTASAFYQGISADMLANRLLAPTIKHNYSNATTTMYVQAAGSEANVTVDYLMSDGSTYQVTETIPANRMFSFDPAGAGIPSTNCGFNTATSPCYGVAEISSDAPIAGVLIEHPHSGTPITFVQAIRLSVPQDESTMIYVPSVKNDFCGSSGCGVAGAAVMNVGSSTATVEITLTVTKLGINADTSAVSVGDVFTQTVSIPAGENYNFSKWNNNLGGLPEGTLAAAVIESTNGVPLIGSSNDAKTQPNFPGEAKVKYSAFADELATPLAYAPMVKEFYGMFTGGVTVQNVGTMADYITIELHEFGTNNVCTLKTKTAIPVGGAAETNYVSVNGSNRFDLSGCASFSGLAGSEYSVNAYTDSNQDIIIMVTENTPDGILDISRYEGVNP